MKHLLYAFPLTLVALVTSLPALASTSFPAELEKHLGVDTLPASPPYCTLCHLDDVGGTGTVITPFGRAVFMRGALAGNLASLDSAIDQLESLGSDSDGDGAADIDELRAGMTPNQGSGETSSPLADIPLPQTGCTVNGAADVQPLVIASCFGAGLLWVGRRRRRPHA